MSTKKLKILFVGTEAAPFAKVGGLGEVMAALPRAMRQLGHDVRTFIPKYLTIPARKFPMRRIIEGLPLVGREKDPYGLTVSNVLEYTAKKGGAISYFLENQEYYEKRANVYGYADDTVRWMLLSRGALEFIRHSEWVPDVIVANDWATGFIPNLLATEYKNDPVLSRIACTFLIHNLRHQGFFDIHFLKEEEMDMGDTPVPDVLGKGVTKLNGMRRGIMYADMICAVSPTYAKEILTPEFGEKLDGVLRKRSDRLTGIINGIDTKLFDPSTDKFIKHTFSRRALSGRADDKRALQRMFGLKQDQNAFIVGFVGRLDEQKGINLFMRIAPALFDNIPLQFVLVGTGEKDYRMFFKELEEQYPGRVGVHPFFDIKLPRHILAGADAVIMPSRFEPAGLVQMEAMRYGCVPIARRTGGLADTIEDYVPGEKAGTGFLFDLYDQMALLIAIIRAWQSFRNQAEWKGIMRRGMGQDFSWTASARAHVELCHRALQAHRD